MTYVRVDDRYPEHPKVVEVGIVAEGLWLRGLCYAGRNQTDGFIPAGYVRRMADVDGESEAARLVDAGLWDAADGGWTIHDYTDWQRTKDEIQDIGAKRAEAGRRGGKQKASNLLTRSSGLPEDVASKRLPDTDTESDTDTNGGNTPPTPQDRVSNPIPLNAFDEPNEPKAAPPPVPPPPSPPKQRRGKPGKTRWPDGFSLTEALRTDAVRAGIRGDRVDAVFDDFRDKALAKGYEYADWPAAWRSWVRSPYQAQDRSESRRSPPPPGQIERGNAPKDGGLAAWRASGNKP